MQIVLPLLMGIEGEVSHPVPVRGGTQAGIQSHYSSWVDPTAKED